MKIRNHQSLHTHANVLACDDGISLNATIELRRRLKHFHDVRLVHDLSDVSNSEQSADALIVSARTASAAPAELADFVNRLNDPAIVLVQERTSNGHSLPDHGANWSIREEGN